MHPFFAPRVSNLSSSAEQPASLGEEGSAAQPVLHGEGGSAAQPVLQMRSVADVQRWLDTQCLSEYSLQHLREAVAILRHPKPRQEEVQRLQSPSNWNVPQKRAQKKRPLPEIIEELKRKVLEAARKLHTQSAQINSSASGSAEQPAFVSPSADARPDIPGAARPDISMRVPRDFDINDFKLARKREGAWCREQAKLRRLANKPNQKLSVVVFALLQDCRKYYKSNWIADDEKEHMKKLLRQLEILALPHITSKACRELYNLIGRNSTLGPFVCRDDHGHQVEQHSEHYRAGAFDVSKLSSLISFFCRREPLPAEAYPYLASYLELLRKIIDHDVKVQWKKWSEDVREIWEGFPRTQDLWLLRDYAEYELDYLEMARDRDRVMGIPIESEEAIFDRFEELYPHPSVCSNSGWCRDYYVHQACACDKSFDHDLNCVCAACIACDFACESNGSETSRRVEWTNIQAYKAANLAMGLGPCRPSPSIGGSAAQPADIAMS